MTTGDEVQARNRALLDAVRIRRDRLYDALLAVERALAAPAGDTPDRWATGLTAPIDNLQEVLEAHVASTEGDDGLFEQIRVDAPHLLKSVERLQDDHAPLLEATEQLGAALPTVHDDEAVERMRAQALDLVRRLLEHRHHGAELVYDAYSVDVSPAD